MDTEIFMKFCTGLINVTDICAVTNYNYEFDYILTEAKLKLETALKNGQGKQRQFNSDCLFLLDSLIARSWEQINTGSFSAVPITIRNVFAMSNLLKLGFLLIDSENLSNFDYCLEILDAALLIGNITEMCLKNTLGLATELSRLCNTLKGKECETLFPIIGKKPFSNYPCDIQIENCPAVETFHRDYFVLQKPVLLRNVISHWPALSKWRDIHYLYKMVGNRMAPVEFGKNYASSDWSQRLIKLQDFLKRQFGKDSDKYSLEYLAQHELFDQIPELGNDICLPDYCNYNNSQSTVDIKIWIGPKGTVSQMHQDPIHNILCQVVGSKKIILAAPGDAPFLYPHSSKFLTNTSMVDIENINYNLYPLAKRACLYTLILQEGECVYIPPKWWHYVRSLQKSISVSFWWI